MATLENRLYLDSEGNPTEQTPTSPIENIASQNLANEGYVPVSTSNINAGTLAEEPEIDYQTYQESAPFNASNIDYTPVAPLGETQQQANTMSTELQNLYDQTLGESAYRAEQEEAQGIAGLTATQRDLEAQLKGLINEAKAIPLQLQEESTGRGITAGGLAPIEASKLRQNAIKALTVNSLLEASRGNLATALDLVDRAVAQKYDPIKEKIAVKIKNLELIRNSEAYTQDERRQAQRQIDIQNAQLKRVADEEKAETDKMNIALEAAKFGVDALTLNKIRNAKDAVEATQIAQEAGVYASAGEQFTLSPGQARYDAQGNLIAQAGDNFTLSPGQTRFDAQGNIMASVIKPDENPLDELLSPNELALFNAPAGSTMRDVMGLIPKTELTGTQKFAEEIKLGQQFEGLVGESRAAATAVGNINASLDIAEKAMGEGKSINAASQGVLVAFQKLLDPTSVVRESEYARSGNGQSLWDRMQGTWQKINQGGAGVTMEELENFVETANVFLKGYENTALKHAKRMQVISERQGLDLNSILTEDMVNLINKSHGYKTVDDFLLEATNEQLDAADALRQTFPDLTDDDLLELINEQLSFNKVGGDTNQALPEEVAKAEPGEKGGQCGRFVNKATGLGLGDSYQSKMAKMDSSITEPEPGMVFVMPYGSTGHTGFIVAVNWEKGTVTVKDSNYSLDEKVKVHEIPINKITGLRRTNNLA